MKKEDKKISIPTALNDTLVHLKNYTSNELISESYQNLIKAQENSLIIYKASQNTIDLYNKTNDIGFQTVFSNPLIQSSITISNNAASNPIGTAYENTLKLLSGIEENSFYGLNQKLTFPIFNNNSIYTSPVEDAVAKTLKLTSYAQKSISSITTQNLGSKVNLNNETKQILTSSFSTFSETYSNLNKSYLEDPSSFSKTNPLFYKVAPVQLFSTANLFEAISVEEKVTVEEEILKNEKRT